MSLVIDASVALSWCFQEERRTNSELLLDQALAESVFVPPIWPIEIANGLGLGLKKGRLSQQGKLEAVDLLGRVGVTVVSLQPEINVEPILAVMGTYGLTAYDASYLELAQRLRVPLATFDRDLAKAARAAGVAVLGD